MKLKKKDLDTLQQKKIEQRTFIEQLQTLQNGIPYVKIVDSARIDKGIFKLKEELEKKYIQAFEINNQDVVKFIPASGAATRMFRLLIQFLTHIQKKNKTIEQALLLDEFKSISNFLSDLHLLPFYKDALAQTLNLVKDFKTKTNKEKRVLVLQTILAKEGLHLANLPKGLIPFHQYIDKTLTPFEEHLEEAIFYCAKSNEVRLHFTITKNHEEKFKTYLQEYQQKYNPNIHYKIDFSYQDKSTDTIAVNLDNTLFRDKQGKLCFRPGGHGALIHNLNNIDANIIFIKNIDNVSKRQKDKEDTIKYKKVLAGMLLDVQQKIFKYQNLLDQNPSEEVIKEIQSFMKKSLNIRNPENKASKLFTQLHRPIRVCGMVKNNGAPGGGPFWIENENGEISLQIVEISQINTQKEDQLKILKNASHFNPVDIVCSVKDYKGNKFNLLHYVNPKRGFISEKSIEGKEIKALELPGLWNGAMEHWHNIFVEVPISTFNPVKTVMDLLQKSHLEV